MKKVIFLDVVFAIPLKKCFTYKLEFENEEVLNRIVGSRVLVDFGKQKNKVGVVVGFKKNLKDGIIELKDVKSILDKTPLFDKEQINLALKLSKYYLSSIGETLNQFFPIEEIHDISFGVILDQQNKRYKFSIEQEYLKEILNRKKVLFIPESIKEKFKFYKNIILYSLEKNQQSIIVFPSNYHLEDFYRYLLEDRNFLEIKKELAVYSGSIKPQERYKIWFLFRNNFIKVVLCTKIGIFLPIKNVKMVIVDEVQEKAFLNKSVPMFHIYDVVELRFKNKKIIYCSLTPSVKLFYENKRYIINYSKNSHYSCEIVFTKSQLLDVIRKEIYKFKQIIIFLPYKSYSKYLICNVCGKFYLHSFIKKKENFFCICGGKRFKEVTGIENFTEHLKKNLFKEANIERLDSSIRDKKIKEIIEDFNNYKIDIIVTTTELLNFIYRINFQNVGSVYFCYFDNILNRPDYLTYEDIFKILRLFKILLNTNLKTTIYLEVLKEHENLKRLKMSYEDFYKTELRIRKELKFPPYVDVMYIEIVYSNFHLEIIENMLKNIEKIKSLKFYILDFNQEIKNKKLKSLIFLKLFNKQVKNEVLSILSEYIKENMEIRIRYE